MNQVALRACAFLVCASALVASCSTGGADDKSAPAESTRTSVIGPSGGSIEGDGVTIAIPAGALGADQEIRVTRTTGEVPSGIVALSPIYRFEPDGLSFDVPARVTFTFNGSGDRATVMWSSPNGYDALPSETAGTTIAANVVHFSTGFVGQVADTSPIVDAGPARIDATSEDGASPNPCGCAAGLACCSGQCRNTQADEFNCGGCGKACTNGTCMNGACMCGGAGTPCDAGSKCCSGKCSTTMYKCEAFSG